MPGSFAFIFDKRTVVWVAVLFLCPLMYGQGRERGRGQQTDPSRRRPEVSELAQDNLNRVAASSVQIREILLKDAGLLVELKRWIAKEASDYGQIVEDSNLSDQAIFDRLDHDVVFRSVATRLLQRYGYLLPTTNPDSTYGKQEELVLKERARRLVQIEAQEDAEPLKPETDEQKPSRVERTTTCDPQESECEKSSPRKRRSDRSPETEQPLPDTTPRPSPNVPLTLQTELPSSGLNPREESSPLQIELASSSFRNPADIPFNLPGAGPANSDDLPALRYKPRYSDGGKPEETKSVNDVSSQSPRSHWKTPRRIQDEEDAAPVRMVHQANPYADIPSLYDMYVQAAVWQRPAERFGLEVFRNTTNDPDAVPMDLPVGPDYVVGTGDSLAIDLWGSVSQRLVRLVDREGRVSLPDTAPLLVSGKNLGEIQLDLQHALRSVFRDVSADVSVSRLRTVRVYVVGEVAEPGAYDISSLSTPLNALFAAGGITARGSLRALRHYRGKELVEQVDAYDLLLHGVRADLKRLENGDTLQVPPVGPQVTVEGMVRRPAVYELANETSLAEVLELSGGILPTAALRHIEVQRIEAHTKRTMLTLDLTSTDSKDVETQLLAFQIRDGDQIHIFPIASFNEDAIYLQGHVLRPGRYSYKPGMKLTDLISSYADLLPEPAPHYAEIVRLNAPDFHPSVESFDISAALANPAAAPLLKALDTVRIFSRYDFEAPPEVWVGGEVRKPGPYRTSGQAHLRDAIYLAGGITPDAAMDSAQLFRTQPDGTLKILSVDLREALAGDPVDNIILQSRDRLLIHKSLARVDAPTVDIRGEVAKPGRYPLTSNMRVEDLVRVAGGLKRSAFADSADLTRFVASGGSNQHLEIKLASALSGDAHEDLPLHNGDVLAIGTIPQWNDLGASVTLKGEVQHPATYGIEPGERLSSLLARSGGFTGQAFPYGAVLVRPEVREIEMRAHLELVSRIKSEEGYLRSLPEGDADQKSAKLAAIAQTETALRQLEATAPLGRVVVHIPSDPKRLAKTDGDIVLRDGDVLVIPKKANYVLVSGQVFNPTAVSYLPGKSAKWYLSQSGGVTQIADKSAVFVVRADGSVLSAKNNSGFWLGDPMSAVLKPGDSIIVPERAPKIGSRNYAPIMQAAQVASSIALTVAYIHP
ncbi:MAG TPA: SLBB domain-containing protein [Candidatus Dormibacteraeota bacterium]|nr:SLBB domain-containing protein [Candidatus Dormibacteraeota bacterium]